MNSMKTVLRKLPIAITVSAIPVLMYRFNQSNRTACQVELNEYDGTTVMLKGTSDDIERSWEMLQRLIHEFYSQANTKKQNSDEENSLLEVWSSRTEAKYIRPIEAITGNIIGRYEDGQIYLLNEGALLVDALDWLVRQFGRSENATPFFAEPIWRESDLPRFGYNTNTPDICRIGHLDENTDHYWQNATCDNIWKSLAGKRIDNFKTFTSLGTCCRNERRQYHFLERLKTFRMREIVAVGNQEEIEAFRKRALLFIKELNYTLQLNATLERANDPFFILDGSSTQNISNQYTLPELIKIEYRPQLYDEKSFACASFNIHGNFFSKNLNYTSSGTKQIWTSCAAFGLERLAWAVIIQHGIEISTWPSLLRSAIKSVTAEENS